MTVRAIAGLVLLNGFLLAVGLCLLYGIRGARDWADVGRLSGLAYLLGVTACGTLWVVELAVGVPFTTAAIVLTGLVVAAGGVLAGRRRGLALPAGRPRLRLPGLSLASAVFGGAAAVLLEALFRSGRLRPLTEYDAWAFWVPKAKAIYYFHGLDGFFFTTLPGPSYPPLVPALEAASFHFMGGPDAVTLHLQFWFLFAGFVAAVVGILEPRVPPLLLWPSLLLAIVSPEVIGRALQPQADLLLDELLAVAALLVGLWLVERRSEHLVVSAFLLAGAMVTKREGFLLTACILGAALAVTLRGARSAWPKLLAVGVLAFLPSLPWRIWFERRGLPSDAPAAGGFGLFDHLDRAWPSLRLTLRVLFTYDQWLLVAPLALIALLAAFLAGRRLLAGYAALLFAFGVAGLTWITWSFPDLPITENAALNPIIRSVGSLVLMSAGVVPLLLAAVWRREPA